MVRPDLAARVADATAEDLPFPDGTFDAAITTFSYVRTVGSGVKCQGQRL